MLSDYEITSANLNKNTIAISLSWDCESTNTKLKDLVKFNSILGRRKTSMDMLWRGDAGSA